MRRACCVLAIAGVGFVLDCSNAKGGSPTGGLNGGTGSSAGSGGSGGSGIANSAGTAGLLLNFDAGLFDGATETPTGQEGTRLPRPAFPKMPILGQGAPSNAAALFAGASGAESAAPCISDPGPDAMYPGNWLRPRVSFKPTGAENLFEFTLSTPQEPNELVVYTTNTWWTMPRDMWQRLTNSNDLQKVEINVRGGVFDGGTLTGVTARATQSFYIAPMQADAGGSILYAGGSSDSAADNGALKGFLVGDESVEVVLTTANVNAKQPQAIGGVFGYFAGGPDGKFVSAIIGNGNTPWKSWLASIEKGSEGIEPAFVTAGGRDALRSMALNEVSLAAFSPARWNKGEHVEILSGSNGELRWVLLDAPGSGAGVAYGTLARDGDPKAGNPSLPNLAWSHDGEHVLYPSSNSNASESDLYVVPYNDGKGGMATPLSGAAEPDWNEYYPDFSADDRFVIFSRSHAGGTETAVVPATGGKATPLRTHETSTCVTADADLSPRFSPFVKTVAGTTYYWFTFSSLRFVNTPQLYLGALTVTAGSTAVQSYGAVHLWNLPEDEASFGAVWTDLNIPNAPDPEVPPR